MKTVILLILLVAFPCHGFVSPANPASPAVYGSDLCGDTGASGTYNFWLSFDYSGDTDKACKDSGTSTIDGTASGATIDTWANHGISGPSGGGTYGVKMDANDETVDYTITAADIINTSEGTLALDIYLAASTGNNTFIQVGSGDDEMSGWTDVDGKVNISHQGQTTIVTENGTDAISDTTWATIRIAWSVTAGEVSVKVGGNSWTTQAGSVTAFGVAATTLEVGDGGSGKGMADTIYIDNFRISETFEDDNL